MNPRLRHAARLFALALFAAACTGSGAGGGIPTEAPVPSSPETASPAPSGPGSAQAALEKLCPHATQPSAAHTSTGPTPAAIAQVEQQVQRLRHLSFTHRVPVDAATHAELVRGLSQSFDASYPAKEYERRSVAWQTIGAIPPGDGLRAAVEKFAGSQVIGYYDPESGELVFIGAENPSPIEKVTLAHELTHALDDQHFDLNRLDTLQSGCRDETFQAALGAVEGDATYFMVLYAQQNLTLDEQISLGQQSSGSTAGIPSFVVQYETWPYTAGLAFIEAMDKRGGISAVNHAMRDLPVSTEQVMHPERYPNDVPMPVNIADLGPKLGPGFTDLDVMPVGEAFLSILLGLRLSKDAAGTDAAGWDGGIYRAWSDGSHVALVLSTAWDRPQDAAEFASGIKEWLGSRDGQTASVLPVEGQRVRVLFASDAATLSKLKAAAS